MNQTPKRQQLDATERSNLRPGIDVVQPVHDLAKGSVGTRALRIPWYGISAHAEGDERLCLLPGRPWGNPVGDHL